MRKYLVFALLLALALLLPVLAFAEGGAIDGTAFFDWKSIGTFSGAVALVVFLVQMLKLPMDRVWRVPTQYVVYVISLGVLLLAQLFLPALGGLTWESGLLCVFNAVLVALAAMSTYDVAIGKVERAKAEAQLIGDSIDLDEVLPVGPPPDTTANN